MDDKLRKIQKGASREAARQAGAYDGRFSPRVEKDPKHDEEKYKCREKIDPKEFEHDDLDDVDLDVFEDPEGEVSSSYSEDVSFNPFAELVN